MVRSAERSYDSRALEARVAAFWKQEDVPGRARRARESAPPWYFLDGPPYATGHIHIGTARNKVLKDVMLRHLRMRGYNVRDQPGYDMHGLPIEVKVEKELSITNKKEIEALGIDRFVEACRKFALDHLHMMNDEFKELAVWMDWDRPYMTITDDYIEGAWWAIERAHERGLLFESERVLTWCWRCETALANAEVEHEEREDPSVYVKFPLTGRDREHLVIWTTTPWTLPANVAIAVHPEITYAKVHVRKPGVDEILYVAADVVESVAKAGRYEHFEVLARMPGSELEGLHYTHPFLDEVPYHQTPASGWNYRVILGKHVAADRTGLVHTATGHGVEDYEVGKQYGIPVFSPVGDDGRYTEAAGSLKGLAVKSGATTSEADGYVIEALDHKGLLLASRVEKHSYGHCWRCKNALIFRSTSQWFIEIPKIQERMIEEVKRVQWTPEWAGSARQLDWVQNARDWCISRQRYWGIPLPVWKCTAQSCDEYVVIGTRRELQHVSDYQGGDLHRPYVDKVRVACPRRGCGGVMKRVPDVLDVWFDSAVASWASLGWPGNKEPFQSAFPAQWICEGLDQTRGWFYSQLAAGVAAMDRVPYERVLMHGWVLDEQGRAMSKSLGNNLEPRDILPKYGVDAFRFSVVASGAPWEDISYGVETARAAQRTLNILWNVHVFATGYMATDGWCPGTRDVPNDAWRAEDRWLTSRLQTTIADTTRFFETQEFHRAAREIERFVLEDLSRWYVRLVRERVWVETDSTDKDAAYETLHDALLTVSRLLAPFAPHTAEAMYQDLTQGRQQFSAHVEEWPVADAALTDYDLEHDMGVVRTAVDAAAYARQKANMKLRWPVATLVFASDSAEVRGALNRFQDLLKDQANAKSIDLVGGEWEALHLQAVPNKSIIGRTYRQDGPRVIEALRNLSQEQLRALRDALRAGEAPELPVEGLSVRLTPELVTFETTLPEHTSGADFDGGSVYVDTEVTPALQAEGAARDLTRRVQEMRKLLGLPMASTIRTEVTAPEEFAQLVSPHLAQVAQDTRSAVIAFVDKPQGALVRDWDLEDTTLVIGVAEAATVPPAPKSSTAAPAPSAPAPDTSPPPPAAPRAKPAAAKNAPPKKPAAKKASSKKPAAKKAPPKTPAAKKASPKKPAAKKAPPKKPAAKKAGATKKAPQKPVAKKPSAKKPAAKKGAAKKGLAKKAAPKKTSAKKSAAKKPAKKGARKR